MMDAKKKCEKKIAGRNQKGKLSLRRKDTSGKEVNDGNTSDQRNIGVLKVITGESSLDQSEDFRDVKSNTRLPVKKANPNKLKNLLSHSRGTRYNSKPSQHNNNNNNNFRMSTLTCWEFVNGKEKAGNSDANNKSKSQVDDTVNQTSMNVAEDTANAQSITSCTIVLSKLPLGSKKAAEDNHDNITDVPNSGNIRKTSETNDNGQMSMDTDNKLCPVCRRYQRDLSGSQEMQDHVNKCLNKHFSATCSTNEDEHLARHLQVREQKKVAEEKLSEELFFCQLCHKDLNRMNSTRRIQHVNRCIDIYETERLQQDMFKKQSAKRQIPDCPICGLLLNTKLQRESHLKRCSREQSVSAAQLIRIVRRQEEEFASRSDTQPQDEIQERNSTIHKQKQLPRTKSRRTKRIKEQKADVDEETQVAIALSASLAIQHDTKIPDESASNAPVRQKRYRKKKNIEKEIPVLLIRSDTERQRMLENRLAHLVAPQDVVSQDTTPLLHPSRVANKCNKHLSSSQSYSKSTLLWGLSAQNDPEVVSSRTPFYVSQLKPNIAPEQRKMPVKEHTEATSSKQAEHVGTSANLMNVPNDNVVTQTVSSTLQVLMDLEEEGNHASSTSFGRSRISSLQSSIDMKVPPKQPDEHERVVLQQLSGLINNDVLSDVKIQTADGNVVYAHKFILHFRCPSLLQHLDENANSSKSIYSLDIPQNVLLSILKYVYCGSIDINGTIALKVFQYAQKFQLPDLARACQPILKTRTTPHKSLRNDACDDKNVTNSTHDFCDDEDDYQEKDLNQLIQSLWDDSEDESKSSDMESDSEKQASQCCPDEEEMQEIYEYASTQAKQAKQSESTTPVLETLKEPLVDQDTWTHSTDSESTELSTLCVADNFSEDKNIAFGTSVQQASVDQQRLESQSSDKSSQQPLPSLTGRLTRRGWTAFSAEKTSPKKPKKTLNGITIGFPSQQNSPPNSTYLNMIIDDFNEQDVEMEDISQNLGANYYKYSESATGTSEQKYFITSSQTQRNIPLREDTSTGLQNITKSSSPNLDVKKSKYSHASENISQDKTGHSSEIVGSWTRGKDIDPDIGEESNNLENHLNESEEESDTSWIIPNTPPARPSNLAKNVFVLPQKRASQPNQSLVASTPVNAENKMNYFIGSNYIPKISPVKIVLEKLSLNISNAKVTETAGGITINKQTTDLVSNANKPSPNDTTDMSPVTILSQSTQCDKPPNTQQEKRDKVKHGTVEQSCEGSSSDCRNTRLCQSPDSQNQKYKNTLKDSTQAKLKNNLTHAYMYSKNNQTHIASKETAPVRLTNELSHFCNRSRMISVADSGKGTPNASGSKVSDIPDGINIPQPVEISDDSMSPSPTPSPKFCGSSVATFGITKKGGGGGNFTENHEVAISLEKGIQDEFSHGEFPLLEVEHIDRPFKHKRKQSMPMRSPDKLLLTTNDTAVHIVQKSRVKRMSKLPHSTPKIHRKPPYFSVKKKYKSFSPLGHNVLTRRRTRLMSKGAPVLHNGENEINTSNSETKCHINNGEKKSNVQSVLEESQRNRVNGAQNNQILNQYSENDVKESEDNASGVDTDHDELRVTNTTNNKQIDTETEQASDEALFAFDVEDGGFHDFHDYSGSNHSDLQNGVELQNSFQIHKPSSIPPSPKDSLSLDNGQDNSSESSSVKSLPEVRIPKVCQKENVSQELWAKVCIMQEQRKVTSPVITEKVMTLENYTIPACQSSSTENYENGVDLTRPSLVPSHRQATASPTLQEHQFSPTQTMPFPSENDGVGYFGCGSESFLTEMQEEVIESRKVTDEVVGEIEDGLSFAPPPCVVPTVNQRGPVALVKPIPIPPNIDDDYYPPAPITPMLRYDEMDTPALRKETFKYGLKPLRKKQARLKLKEIYRYTHQVLETSVDDDDVDSNQNGQATQKAPLAKKASKAATKAKAAKRNTTKGQGSNSRVIGTAVKMGSEGAKKNSTSTKQRVDVESSGDTSDTPSCDDCPEDSILAEDEEEIPMSQPLSKNPEEAILTHIKGNTALHHKILMYEPLFIKEFHKELKEAGIYCSILNLKTYLDKQCIVFRAEANVNRHVRKPRKKKKK